MQKHFIEIYQELAKRDIQFNVKQKHVYFSIGDRKWCAKSKYCVIEIIWNDELKKIEFKSPIHLQEVLEEIPITISETIWQALSYTLWFGEYQYCPLVWIIQKDHKYLKTLLEINKRSNTPSFNEFRRNLRRAIIFLKSKNNFCPEVFSKGSEINNKKRA